LDVDPLLFVPVLCGVGLWVLIPPHRADGEVPKGGAGTNSSP